MADRFITIDSTTGALPTVVEARIGVLASQAARRYADAPWRVGSTLFPRDAETGRIAGWGSSTIAGLADAFGLVASTFGAEYIAGGKGGERFEQTEARLGSRPALLTLDGGQIPASGSVAATASNMSTANDRLLTFTGYLSGVECTLAWSGSGTGLTLTRVGSGSTVTVPAGTPFIPKVGQANRDAVTLLQLGKNNFTGSRAISQQILESTRRAFQYLVPLASKALVIGHFANSNFTTSQVAELRWINAQDAAEFGALYFDIQEWMCSAQAWEDTDLTPTSDDLTAQAAGQKPPSLSADAAHFNTVAYDAIARRVEEYLSETLGWYESVPEVPWTYVTSDTFVGADSDNIHGRASNAALGGAAMTWSSSLSGASGCIGIGSNRMVRASNTGAGFAGVQLSDADAEVSFTFTDLPLSGSISIRRTALAGGSSSRYQASFNALGSVYLQRVDAGTAVTLSGTVTVSPGDEVTLRAHGSNISVLINGTKMLSVVDTTYTAAGWAGVAVPTLSTDATVEATSFKVKKPAA